MINKKKPYLNDHGDPQFFGDHYEEIMYKLDCISRKDLMRVFKRLAKYLNYEVTKK